MTNRVTEVLSSDLCPCGSGLDQAHCCALQRLKQPNQAELDAFTPTIEQAQQLYKDGNPAAAEQLCIRILQQVPAHLHALRLLIDLKQAADQPLAQEALLRRLVKIRPNDGDLAYELALLLYRKPDLAGALYHVRSGIRLKPRSARAHHLMGMILTDLSRYLEGEFHYRKALELQEPVGKLCAGFGYNLRKQGKLDEAEKYYRMAMELEPDNVTSLLGWVVVEEVRRDFERAWELLHQAEAMAPVHDKLTAIRATLHSRANEHDKALAELEKIKARNEPKNQGVALFFQIGRVLDKLGRYDEAFANYDTANRKVIANGRGTYNEEGARRQAVRLKSFFNRNKLKILPRATTRTDCPQPLFIIGFPRSGTTMTEQILTAHPAICAGGELTTVYDLIGVISKLLNSPLEYPESLADLWMGGNQGVLDDFRDRYLKHARQLGILEEGAHWFTDKMPLNETHLGLIHLVFPQSPVVHLLRHPLDVVMSTFFVDLTHGEKCSYQLKTAASHYLLVMDLVEHYKREMDMPYMAVKYEDLVTDQAAHVKKLLEFIGEPWDERCMDFHENTRYVDTASYAQVTEKLYTTSRYRYRNYRKHLEEVIPMLEPVIERLGYTIED